MTTGFKVILKVLENRNYRWYIAGNLCSVTGNWIQRVAMGWLTWELTGSGAWLGIIAFADLFPTFVIGLLAGAISDRTNPLRMLRLIQWLAVAQGAGLALITFMGIVTIEWLVVFAMARGVIVAFSRPPRMTVVYQIAGRDLLSSAIGVNAMVMNSSRFVGPALGGLLVAGFGVGWAFGANAVTFVIFSLCLMMIRLPEDQSPAIREGKAKETGLFQASLEGVRYVNETRSILVMLIILSGMALLARPFTELLPGFASEVFGRGVDGFSTMLSLHGVGAVAGGYLLARRGGTQGLVRVANRALLVSATALILFTTVPSYPLALVVMVVTGATFVIQGIAIQTLIQTKVAPAMRGRVMSIYGIVARGGPALGALMMGLASSVIGLNGPVLAGAILCLGLWAWTARHGTELARRLEPSPEPRRQPPAGTDASA